MSELIFLSVAEIAEGIRSRQFSAVDLVKAHLAQIEKLNPKLNAFIELRSDVLREAEIADKAAERNQNPGPLHGVPLSIKSSIAVAGMRIEAGSKLRIGQIAANDAPLVARLRYAGGIILGTTNTPELLMAWETDNLLYGRTNNPWDLSRTGGGSSGGEAAAISAGLSAGGVGSDGGGSIRVPAHFTGTCGLKPTPGRIPATGHFPPSGGPFAGIGVVGPVARTVGDLKILFEVMQGPDDGDPSFAPVPMRWVGEDELRNIRIGYFEDDGRTPVTSETRNAIQAAATALAGAGFKVEPFRPEGLEAARQLWWKFFGITGGMLLDPIIRGQESSLSPILQEFMAWVRAEASHTADTILEMWVERDNIRSQVLQQMRHYPVLLCPVASMPAFRHGERNWKIDGQEVKYLDAWSYCEWFNLLGFPAAVVPVGKSSEGMPIGVQVAGRPWEEEMVLQIAQAVERGCGGWQCPPIS